MIGIIIVTAPLRSSPYSIVYYPAGNENREREAVRWFAYNVIFVHQDERRNQQ